MKIEKEIKGEIFCSSINEFYVKLKLRDERLDWVIVFKPPLF